MKKILIVNTVPFGMGGISSVIVNYLNNMDISDMEITVIANTKIEKSYKDILNKIGVNIIILERNCRLFKYIYKLNNIIRNNKFDVIHIHGNSSTMVFESIPAYLNKIPKRIVHCHNVSCDYKVLNKVLWPIFKRTYTISIACSKEAGEWLFKDKKEFLVLNNAINLEKYNFNKEIRDSIRNELKIKDSYLIGHVGYFNEQKNHEKLFQIIHYLKNKINVKLLCISGNKEIPNNIREMIEKYNLENNVEILLRRSDVNRLLQGVDFFVFPSKFEGLGLALIEAQATGVYCLASNYVPKVTGVCKELVTYLDLQQESNEWGKVILDIKENITKARIERSETAISKLKAVGYDITLEAEKLRTIYMK